jgi:lysophospholipase L1-like esterase
MRQPWIIGIAILTFIAIGLVGTPTAAGANSSKRWVGTWATAPQPALGAPTEYNNQTLRLIVRPVVGGKAARVRISNAFGTGELAIGSAHIAWRAVGAGIRTRTDHALTFGGRASVAVPAGAQVLSDPVAINVEAQSDLAVSIYLPTPTAITTNHLLALQTSYVSPSAGDLTGAADIQGATTITSWPFITGVDVTAYGRAAAVVALGDSITDGAGSTSDNNRRWTDLFALRLGADCSSRGTGVLNEGIIGNRMLFAGPAQMPFLGPAGLDRFDRDVLSQAGVRYVIVLLGINDIGLAGSAAPISERVSAAELIAGYRQIIGRAHEKSVRAIGSTLTPFEDALAGDGYYTKDKEIVREAVNRWIRTSEEFDGVIDFDRALRDPGHPTRLRPKFDGGDHLHPNDAGHQAMADAIDLRLFEKLEVLPSALVRVDSHR